MNGQVVRRSLRAVFRLAKTGHGDVKRLRQPPDQLRLRVGDWRVRFVHDEDSGALDVLRVWHRISAPGAARQLGEDREVGEGIASLLRGPRRRDARLSLAVERILRTSSLPVKASGDA